jgi:hypothetical protein
MVIAWQQLFIAWHNKPVLTFVRYPLVPDFRRSRIGKPGPLARRFSRKRDRGRFMPQSRAAAGASIRSPRSGAGGGEEPAASRRLGGRREP